MTQIILVGLMIVGWDASAALLEMQVRAPISQFDEKFVEVELAPNRMMKIPREFFKSRKIKRGDQLFMDFDSQQIKKVSFYKN